MRSAVASRALANPIHEEGGLVFHLRFELSGILLEMRHPLGGAIGEILSFLECGVEAIELVSGCRLRDRERMRRLPGPAK